MNLDQLPIELLQEIFKHLKPQEKLRITRVCKKFNEIIGSSPKLMSDLKLCVKFIGESEFYPRISGKSLSDLRETKRWYQHVEVSTDNFYLNGLDIFAGNLMEVFEGIGRKIKSLRIRNCCLNFQDFIVILDCIENLEELVLENLKIPSFIKKPLKISNLKKLTLDFEDSSLLEFLLKVNGKLESLDVRFIGNFSTNFWDYIGKQKNLKHLKLSAKSVAQNFSKNSIKFQLLSFELKDPSCDFEKLQDFMEKQFSLESLDLSGCERVVSISSQLLESIFRMKNLRFLKLPLVKFDSLLSGLQCPGIKKLEFLMDAGDLSMQMGIIVKIMMALETLKIQVFGGIFTELDLIHLNSLDHLKSLDIEIVDPSVLQHMNLKNLSNLKIKFSAGNQITRELGLKFLQNHHKLKKIIFEEAIPSKSLLNSLKSSSFELLQFICQEKFLEEELDLRFPGIKTGIAHKGYKNFIFKKIQ
jgi:hypothetical protein